ncbi:MAG: peptidoglycan bridge formation glycyltransferase FemA/FemB family protein [Microgenomates group bacterium]
MEVQQSTLYQQYILALGWSVDTLDGSAIFYRKLPFIGVMAKIQRPMTLPYIPKLIPLLQKLHVRTLLVEPKANEDPEVFKNYIHSLSKFFKIILSPFLPTKTILVNVTPTEEKIFSSLEPAKRRAVRRAEKYGISISSSNDIDDLIAIKSKAAGTFGSMTTYGIDKLWNIFYKKQQSHILLAKTSEKKVVGGVLLLLSGSTCYYWIAGATKKGKHMFAPTLLVWEALKFAHGKKCTYFDFVGVWDERKPKQYTEWKGFTKFKEGFGGKELYYPLAK